MIMQTSAHELARIAECSRSFRRMRTAHRLTLALTLWCLALAASWAQGPERFKPEDFRARQEQHIAKAAKLSKSEAEKFFPLFREMKERQRQKAQEAQKLKRQHPATGATDKEYASIVAKIAELDAEVAKTEAEYYKKLCKVVSPKKVYEAILADDEFSRHMVQQFREGKAPRQQKPRK